MIVRAKTLQSQQTRTTVTVDVFVGGACSAAAAHSSADFVVVVDAEKQLPDIPGDDSRYVVFAIGTGQTADSLVEWAEHASEETRAEVRRRTGHNLGSDLPVLVEKARGSAGVNLSSGLAASPEIGALAWCQALDTQQIVSRLEREVVIPSLQKTQGGLGEVLVRLTGGAAGGTNGGLGGLVMRTIARAFESRLADVIVHEDTLLIGPISHLGYHDRVLANGSATSSNRFAELFSERGARNVRALTLAELPAGLNPDARSARACELLQAARSSAVAELRSTPEPNEAMRGPFGSVHRVHAEWADPLLARQVAQDVARSYAKKLKHSEVGGKDEMPVVRVDARCAPDEAALANRKAALDSVAAGQLPQNLLATLEKPTSRRPGGTVYVDAGSGFIGSRDLEAELSTPVTELDSFHKRVKLTAALQRSLGDAEAKRQRELAAAREELASAVAEARGLVTVLCPGTWWERVRSVFASRASSMEGLESLATRCADAADRIQQLELELEVLVAVRRDIVERAARACETLVGGLGRKLEQFAGGTAGGDPLVVAAPMDAALPRLLMLVETLDGSDELDAALLKELSSCAERVTLAGLARIMGCPRDTEPRVAAVAARLVLPLAIRGPYWGGKAPSQLPIVTVTVLPKMDAALFEEVLASFRTHGGVGELALTDTCKSGVNVVALTYYPTSDFADVVTPLLRGFSPLAVQDRFASTGNGKVQS